MSFRIKILNFMLPLSKAIAKIHMPFTHKQITWEVASKALNNVKSGAIIITKSYGELANIFIPGDFSHAGIIHVDEQGVWVIEAKTTGVCKTRFIEFMLTKDKAVILVPLFCDSTEMEIASYVAKSMVGSPYDYYFNSSTEAFYCSELASYGYRKFPTWNKRKTMGVDTVIPDDFYNSARGREPKWKVIWDSVLLSHL